MSGADRFFVDSNILLYYVDPAETAKQSRATEWMDALWTYGRGNLSWQVLHEFYSNATRKLQMDPAGARRIVERLVQWKPMDTSLILIRLAWRWMDVAQFSYWDALILAAAQHSGARYLLSEDFQAGRRFEDVEVVNPFEKGPADLGLGRGERPQTRSQA